MGARLCARGGSRASRNLSRPEERIRPSVVVGARGGTAVSAFDYQAIQLRRMALRGRFSHLFRTIDTLLVPVQPFAPLTLAEISTLGAQPDLILKLQRYTAPFDLTGHPTVTLPGGFSERDMPIGLQLAGRDETTLIRAAVAFQHETSWHKRHPLL